MIDDISIRPAVADDLPFIVDNWVQSYRHAHAAGLIPMPFYQPDMRKYVNWFLARPGVAVHIAVGPLGVLTGFAAVEAGAPVLVARRERVGGELKWVETPQPSTLPYLLYLYVKDSFRGHGIGLELLAAGGIRPAQPFIHASKTPAGDGLQKKYDLRGKWSPLVARFPKTQPLEKK